MKQCLIAILVFALATPTVFAQQKKENSMLVFSKTKGFRHQSIANGKAMFQAMAAQWKARVDTSEDASLFTYDNLKQYKTVVFLNTTGDMLNDEQQAAFEKYIQGGGTFLGIHAAADTEYDWPWYNKLVGAYFASHPKPQKVDYIVKDNKHPSVAFWYPKVNRFEEIYDYKSVQKELINVIMLADEKTYEGGKMGDWHPAAWYHEYDGGRAFYTGLGHHPETFQDADFQKHITGALKWLWQKKK